MYRLISRFRLFVLAGCLGVLLNACSFISPKPATDITNWQQHVAELSQLNQWQLEGKLGYRDNNDGGSAWLNWQQNQQDFNVTLSGPFGAGATRIVGTPQYAQLTQSGQAPITASSPGELTERLFGWQWPVEQLQFWARGIPAPHVSQQSATHNLDGTLAVLQQSNWTLVFSDYTKFEQDLTSWVLPGKIKGQKGDYRFTLVIKDWQPKGSAQ